MQTKVLTDFGLSDKEAKIYLALLQLEVASANEIAKKTGINRSSAYVVIESLKKKGLVNLTPDKKVQQYIAASPETLLLMAKDRSEKSAQVQKKIEEVLPELRAIHKETKGRPRVVVYEGDEALKISYYSTFGPEFRIYKDLTGMMDVVPKDYIEKDALKRNKDGVKMFMISPDTQENRDIVAAYKAHKSPDEFRLIPKQKFSTSKNSKNIGIGIYKDRVKFASAKEKFTIYIINQEITDTLRDLFDLAWEESKRFGGK